MKMYRKVYLEVGGEGFLNQCLELVGDCDQSFKLQTAPSKLQPYSIDTHWRFAESFLQSSVTVYFSRFR